MKRKTVRQILPKDNDLPMAKDVLRFIGFYMNSFDLKEAACKIGLAPEAGEKLFKVPRIKDAIQRRVNLLEGERSRLKAKAELLTVDLLDASLCEEVKSKNNGHIRVRAIELGYRRTGLIRDGEFVGVQQSRGTGNSAKTYGQIHTTTIRKTTTEELVQSSETAVQVRELAVPPPTSPRIELMQPDEVEDYPG